MKYFLKEAALSLKMLVFILEATWILVATALLFPAVLEYSEPESRAPFIWLIVGMVIGVSKIIFGTAKSR